MHYVHSDTLYVKYRRNKSGKKKPAAIVKNPHVLKLFNIHTFYEPTKISFVHKKQNLCGGILYVINQSIISL